MPKPIIVSERFWGDKVIDLNKSVAVNYGFLKTKVVDLNEKEIDCLNKKIFKKN